MVHLCLPNDSNYFCFMVGAWLCGSVISKGPPDASVKLTRGQLDKARARVAICTKANEAKVREAAGEGCKVLLYDGKYLDGHNVDRSEEVREALGDVEPLGEEYADPGRVCLVLWSSGTTGAPKAILHTIKFVRCD